MKSNRSSHLRWYRGTRSRSCSWRTARRTSTGSWRPTRPNTGCTSNELKEVNKAKWKSDITKEQCSLSTAVGNAALLCPIPTNYILDWMDQSFVTELGFKPLSSETHKKESCFKDARADSCQKNEQFDWNVSLNKCQLTTAKPRDHCSLPDLEQSEHLSTTADLVMAEPHSEQTTDFPEKKSSGLEFRFRRLVGGCSWSAGS